MGKLKIAAFDFDWTLVKPKEGRTFPKDVDDWMWLRESVPEVVRNYAKTHTIVLVTDQTKDWKVQMIKNVIVQLDLDVIGVIAVQKEEHKPNPSMFRGMFPEGSVAKGSFFVGDAAGRPGDWSDKDKVFAENVGLKFYTPEEIFPFPKKSVRVKHYDAKEKEVVVMVGYPGAGKSTIANQGFSDTKYAVISGDVFKTPAKMIKEAEKYIQDKSVVFDATNGTKERRGKFIAFAQKHGVGVRCLWVNTSMEQAMEQNRQREVKIPNVVFYTYRKHFEAPEEGECPVVKIEA